MAPNIFQRQSATDQDAMPQVTTGIWTGRTPALEQKMALRDQLTREIGFLESAGGNC